MNEKPLPTPPVPPDLDLSSLSYMPLHVSRLLASDTWMIATGDEAKAAVTLWARSWHQIPAGSLPNDDRLLAALSGAGKKWVKVKDTALRGFLLCFDGRLYHSIICEEAMEAHEKRTKWRDKKRRHRGGQSEDKSGYVPVHVPPCVPRDMGEDNGGETALRDGTGQEVRKNPTPPPSLVAEPKRPVDPSVGWGSAVKKKIEAHWPDDPRVLMLGTGLCAQWIADGLDLALDVLPTVEAICTDRAAKGEGPPGSFKYFSEAIRRRRSERQAIADETANDDGAIRKLWAKRLSWLQRGDWNELTMGQKPSHDGECPAGCPVDLWAAFQAERKAA